MNTQIVSPVAKKYLQEFLDLIEAGASEAEAISQIAQSNEVSEDKVRASMH